METEILQEYKMKQIPEMRFGEFSESFEFRKLDELIKELKSGISVNSEDYPIQDKSEIGILKTNCVSSGFFFERENKKIVSEEIERAKLNPQNGEIIISRMNTPQLVGESGYVDQFHSNLFVPDRLWQTVVDTEKCYSRWLSYFLITNKVRNNLKAMATGTSDTMKNISKPNFLSIGAHIPSLSEQQKIASFLSSVDEKNRQLTRKKELLETYKKGVMQKLFSQEIRFKDENGNDFPEWEWVEGNVLFDSISDKDHNSDLPILAITQDQGAIPRDLIDYKMTVTEKSIASYKVVQKGDFVISLRSFQGGIEYSNYHGICSPAYIILRPNQDNVDREFYKYYLKTSNYIKQLQKNLEGIRDGKMISYKYFSEIKLPHPSNSEQQKIASFLSKIDSKIEIVSEQINKTETFKKGLLQQMFV